MSTQFGYVSSPNSPARRRIDAVGYARAAESERARRELDLRRDRQLAAALAREAQAKTELAALWAELFAARKELGLTRIDRTLGRRSQVWVRDIQHLVCEHFGVHKIDMTSSRRARVVCRPRQVAMYLARELTKFSLPEIGKRFGDRDHTTIMHAWRSIQRRMEADPALAAEVQKLRARLAPSDKGDT